MPQERHQSQNRAQAGAAVSGYPSRLGVWQGVTHQVGLMLLRPMSTAKIINLGAGRLQPEFLVSRLSIAMPPLRPPEEVRLSGTARLPNHPAQERFHVTAQSSLLTGRLGCL